MSSHQPGNEDTALGSGELNSQLDETMPSSDTAKIESTTDSPLEVSTRVQLVESSKNQGVSLALRPLQLPTTHAIVQPCATYPNSRVGHLEDESRIDDSVNGPALPIPAGFKIPEVQSANRRTKMALKELQARYDTLQTKFDKQARDFKAAKSENMNLKSQISRAKVEHPLELRKKEEEMRNCYEEEYNERQKRAMSHSEKLESQVRDLKAANQTVKEERAKLRCELKELKDGQEEATAANSTVTEGLRIAEEKVAELQLEMYAERRDNGRDIGALQATVAEKEREVEDLEASVDRLQSNLNSANQKVDRSKAQWERERQRLSNQIRDLSRGSAEKSGEIATLKADLDNEMRRNGSWYSRSYVHDLRDEIADRKMRMRNLEDDYHDVKSDLRDCRKSVDEKVQEIATLGRRCQSNKHTINNLRSRIMDQEQRIQELEEDRDDKAPLVQVGVDIRLRFLEQERISPMFDLATRDDLRQDVIDRGNAAAHFGNFVADQALFKADLISNDYKMTFQKLYWCLDDLHPADVRYSLKFIKAINFEVTFNSGRGIHGGLGTSLERENAMNVIRSIVSLYNSLAKSEFESSQEVDNLLVQAQRMTEEIVVSYRQRNSRRR